MNEADNKHNKPIVNICAQCQMEFGILPQVQKASKELGISFSHGMCPRHVGTYWKDLQKHVPELTDDEIQGKVKRAEQDPVSSKLDLSKNHELLDNYKKGIFTPEQLQQAQQPAQAAETIQEKWKRLNKVLGR